MRQHPCRLYDDESRCAASALLSITRNPAFLFISGNRGLSNTNWFPCPSGMEARLRDAYELCLDARGVRLLCQPSLISRGCAGIVRAEACPSSFPPHSACCSDGWILFWSLKNPLHPERKIRTSAGALSLHFSCFNPNLLAAGLADGHVAIWDLRRPGDEPVLQSHAVLSMQVGSEWRLDCALPAHGRVRKTKTLLAAPLLR